MAYGTWGLAITLWGLSTAWMNDNLGAEICAVPFYSTPLFFTRFLCIFLHLFFSAQCDILFPFYSTPFTNCSVINTCDVLLYSTVCSGVRRSLLLGFSISALGYLLLATASSKKVVYATLFGILPLGNRCALLCLSAFLLGCFSVCTELDLIASHIMTLQKRPCAFQCTALHSTL